jgi:hypothetical protein
MDSGLFFSGLDPSKTVRASSMHQTVSSLT